MWSAKARRPVVQFAAVADDIDEAHIADCIDIEASDTGEDVQIERRAETLPVLAGQAIDVGRIERAEGADRRRRERKGREAIKAGTVRGHFDKRQFEECIVETVLEDREVPA
jgi:hypothetical protein